MSRGRSKRGRTRSLVGGGVLVGAGAGRAVETTGSAGGSVDTGAEATER